jgi:heptosyltransferase-2
MKILVIKIGALGDVVRTTFIAQALKDKYKKLKPEIYWITQKNAKDLFINNPYVNHLILKENKRSLDKVYFDLIINLEEDLETVQFAKSLKHKDFIGFTLKNGQISPTPSIKEWFNMSALGPKPQNDILKKKNKKPHRQIISEIIGVDSKKYEPFLRLTDEQRKIAHDFLRRYNFSKTEIIIGINTGSADRWPKQLSIKKTSQLIDKIVKKFNAKILLFGGPNEIERNKEIIKQSKSHIIDTGCGNNLLEFPALISLCSIFITTDSLGLHIALALKRKTICLIGPTSSAELDMYGLGEKIVAKSRCLCCYKHNCQSMKKIDINQIIKSLEKLSKIKITLLITAFKEPLIGKAIKSALNQTHKDFEIIVSAPDNETLNIAKKYAKKDSRIKIFKDPGKGKSFALNLIFSKIDTDIIVLTDGDVHISSNTIEEISNLFFDPEIGCATGKPVPIEKKNTKYGYWANFLFDAAHRLRKTAFENNDFIECSGYLFAFRKKFIQRIPLDVAEDTVIPYMFWEKGYKIGYAEKSEVYVKNVDNWKDWVKQKTRTSKAHETLHKYVDIKTTPRVKSFKNEAKGIFWALRYPKLLKEFFWTINLILARFYMWGLVWLDTKFRKKHYGDAWDRVESTK